MTSKPVPVQVRRIVTGHNANGHSCIVSDGPAPAVMRPQGQPNVMSNDVWRTFETPCKIDAEDPTVREGYTCELKPPKNGSVFRVFEFPPDKERNYAAQAAVFNQYGASSAHDTSSQKKHPAMHKTQSVDYAICLSGEIWAVMDEDETLMKAGDVLVQRGTNHASSNRSEQPCRMAFVLIDGE